MLPFVSDLIKWVAFTNEERNVLLESFSTFFPVPEIAQTPTLEGESDDYSARLDLQTDKQKLESLLSIRSILISSLRTGPNAVISLTALGCEALSSLVMLDIAGFYDYLISLEDRMASLGVEFIPTDDDRQKARFSILNKLNT